jgi:hypothetical protein
VNRPEGRRRTGSGGVRWPEVRLRHDTRHTTAKIRKGLGLVDACEALKVSCDETAEREIVAVRITELARRGERSPAKLCDRVLAEAKGRARGRN